MINKVRIKQVVGFNDNIPTYDDILTFDSNLDVLSDYSKPMSPPAILDIQENDSINKAFAKVEIRLDNSASLIENNTWTGTQIFTSSTEFNTLITNKDYQNVQTLTSSNGQYVVSDATKNEIFINGTISKVLFDEASLSSQRTKMRTFNLTIIPTGNGSVTFGLTNVNNTLTLKLDPGIPSAWSANKVITLTVRVFKNVILVYSSKVL